MIKGRKIIFDYIYTITPHRFSCGDEYEKQCNIGGDNHRENWEI